MTVIKIKYLLLIFILLGISFSSKAVNCNSENLSQIEMNECAVIDYDKQDIKLNRFYQTKLKTLSIEKQRGLRVSQREWVKYKEKNVN